MLTLIQTPQIRLTVFVLVAVCIAASMAAPVAAKIERITVRAGLPTLPSEGLEAYTDGNAVSFSKVILEYVAGLEGWNLEYIEASWPECIEMLREGKIDILYPVSRTQDRKRFFDFTDESIFSSWGRIYASNRVDIQSILDLDGKIIAVLKHDVFNRKIRETVKQFELNCTFVEKESGPDAFRSVSEGEVDACAVDRFDGFLFANDFNVWATPIVFAPDKSYFAVPKGKGKDLTSALNQHLAKLKQDPSSFYYQAYEKSFGTLEKEKFPDLVAWALGGGFILLLLSAAFITLLRFQVRSRTSELSARNLQLNAEIADRMQAKEELRRAHGLLENHVKEITGLNKDLEAFDYSVSNALRVPIRHIIGYSRLLNDEFRDELGERGEEIIDKISASVGSAARLIDALLSLSRATRKELALETVELGQLAKMAAGRLQKENPSREVELIIADGLPVTGDWQLLQIALEQLIENAWKFTADQTEAVIEFGETEREGETVYFVRDNGRGFDSSRAERIFTPFHSYHTDQAFEGVGLGLATVKRIVERHGGRIWAESEPGKGAAFYFTLGDKPNKQDKTE